MPRRHDEAHLSSDDIAAATGAAPSTARARVALKRIPSGTRAQRIAELSSIGERLLRVMDPECIPVWMNRPVRALDDRKPLELISGGEYLRVARIVSALEDPSQPEPWRSTSIASASIASGIAISPTATRCGGVQSRRPMGAGNTALR